GPAGICIDRQDTVYIGDTGNYRVLHFLKGTSAVNSATYQLGIPVAPGSLAAVFGKALAETEEAAQGSAWANSLAKRDVVISDVINAPLQYVSSGQINLQIPSNAPPGSARIAIRVADTGELV